MPAILVLCFLMLLPSGRATAKLTDVGRERFEAFFVAPSREEAVGLLMRRVEVEGKDDLIARLVHCDDEETLAWAEATLAAAGQADGAVPPLHVRVAAVILARRDKGSSLAVRSRYGLPVQTPRFRLILWEGDLSTVLQSKDFPVNRVSPGLAEEWGEAWTGELTPERRAELRDRISLMRSGKSLKGGTVEWNDLQYLLALLFDEEEPDAALLDSLWNEGMMPATLPLDTQRNLLIRLLGDVLDESTAGWMAGRLREIRDTSDRELADLAGSTYAYLELKAHVWPVRDFIKETVNKDPGNYHASLPRLLYTLRFDRPWADENQGLAREVRRYEELARIAAESNSAHPVDAAVISEP